MPLVPDDDQHLAQILAGTAGRNRGHEFEQRLASELNNFSLAELSKYSHLVNEPTAFDGVKKGRPAEILLRFLISRFRIAQLQSVKAYWLGGLATAGIGDRVLDESGKPIKRSKADVVVEIMNDGRKMLIGVSTKSCSKANPTNAQLYFTTASSFSSLLRRNGLDVGANAENALKMFCGDEGYKPRDILPTLNLRETDPDRWFWEELPGPERVALELLFSQNQRAISLALLKFAYADDPYPPEVLLHQIRKPLSANTVDVAIYQIDDLVEASVEYKGFELRPYVIRKGRFKSDNSIHFAPRFGIIQFQRGGQKQHPTQLQFNLQAGYFNKLGRREMAQS
jgi:hypothetical protein